MQGVAMTQTLILEETEVAQWHSLVRQAEESYGCQLDESMESYLVFTLMRFMKDQDLATQAIALDYLRAHGLPGSLRLDQLRDIGDQCLLLSGLYPKRAEKRLVRVSYYVNMGRSAYQHLSEGVQQTTAELYQQLAETFVMLMDLLQTIRQFSSPALQPIQTLELWSDTGSQNAFKQLSGNSLPLHEELLNIKSRQ
jgi:hypothetical protein